MGSNTSGAEGVEGKTEEANISSEDPKDPSGKEAVLETSVSEEDAGNGRTWSFWSRSRMVRGRQPTRK
jgi:hypothetical protein